MAEASHFRSKEAHVEMHVMSHKDGPGESSKNIARDLSKTGSVLYVAGGNSMNVGGSNVTVGVYKCSVLVKYRTVGADTDDRDLNNPVVTTGKQPGGFNVHNRELRCLNRRRLGHGPPLPGRASDCPRNVRPGPDIDRSVSPPITRPQSV